MEEYDYETGSYDSAMSRDYDYYVDNGGYASYGAHVSYRGDAVSYTHLAGFPGSESKPCVYKGGTVQPHLGYGIPGRYRHGDSSH